MTAADKDRRPMNRSKTSRSRRRRRPDSPRSLASKPRRYAGSYAVDARGIVSLISLRRPG